MKLPLRNILFTSVVLVFTGAPFAAAQLPVLPSSQLPTQWTTGAGANGHLYALTPLTGNWMAAESYATSIGGHLVSITSAQEQAFVAMTFLTVAPYSTAPLWIGLTDDPAYGGGGLDSRIYNTWTTGESTAGYTNWYPGEPNNLQVNEDYGTINWHYSFGNPGAVPGTWNDVPLNGTTANYGGNNARSLGPYYGVIEVVPEPTTTCLLGGAGALGLIWSVRRRRAAGRAV